MSSKIEESIVFCREAGVVGYIVGLVPYTSWFLFIGQFFYRVFSHEGEEFINVAYGFYSLVLSGMFSALQNAIAQPRPRPECSILEQIFGEDYGMPSGENFHVYMLMTTLLIYGLFIRREINILRGSIIGFLLVAVPYTTLVLEFNSVAQVVIGIFVGIASGLIFNALYWYIIRPFEPYIVYHPIIRRWYNLKLTVNHNATRRDKSRNNYYTSLYLDPANSIDLPIESI